MFDVSQYIMQGRKYYIYGTRDIGDYLYSKISELFGTEAVEGFLETSPTIIEFNGKRVYALSQVVGLDFDEDTYFLLAAANAYEDMRQNLIKRGVRKDRIITLKEIYPYFKTIWSYKGGNLRKVCFWPLIKTEDEDIKKKISWFLPDKAEVVVWCDDSIKDSFNSNVCVSDLSSVEKEFDDADIIYIWGICDDQQILERYSYKVYAVIPSFYRYIETSNYSALYYNTHDEYEKEAFLGRSKEVFSALKNSIATKRANIFCTGPSIDEIYEEDFSESINIITNSMVKDKEFLERIKPKVLMFDDINFYVSPNEYCLRFYQDVLEAVEKYDMYLVVYNYREPLILRHFPTFQDKLIGMPFGAKTYNFPSCDYFCTRGTNNILTELAIPIASALCEEIGLAGCTGRGPEEKGYYWRHNPKTQYIDLMQSVFNMYPSVFRYQKYDNYYERHCKIVRELLEFGEKMGKTYLNLTTSFIPALKERMIK